MASGLVCHSNSEKPKWPPDPGYSFSIVSSHSLTRPERRSMAPHSPDGGVRGSDFSTRTRLPSFSNFLSSAGQPELTSPPRESGSAVHSSPSSDYPRTARFSESELYHRSLPQPVQPQPSFQTQHEARPGTARHDSFSRFSSIISTANAEARVFNHQNPSFNVPSPTSTANQVRPFGHPPLTEAGLAKAVVREEIIPGKGLCYVYEDGSICQKFINGDTVNPKWGTTKAGKPRKRLGQACNTCREKKIKCDPSTPKCAQCQKFGRECKFETTYECLDQKSLSSLTPSRPRTSHRSPASTSNTGSPAHIDAGHDNRFERAESSVSVENHLEQSHPRTDSRVSMNVENLLSPSSTDDSEDGNSADRQRSPKRPRFSASSLEEEISPKSRLRSKASDETIHVPLQSTINDSFSILVDPYEVDEELTSFYLGKYFSYINVAAFCIFPRRTFMHWVKEERHKSREDKMLLYAMMALGAVFAKKNGSDPHCLRFAEIADDAVAKTPGVFELQIIQTRLVLSLLNFSENHLTKAWELCGSAVRAACYMRLNEEDKIRGTRSDQPLFGLNASTFIECKRRTFWAAYIMDCFNGCCAGNVSSINKSNFTLRLPCSDTCYEEGDIPEMPYFNENQFSLGRPILPGHVNFGLMAFLVQIGTIFSHIMVQITQSRYMDPTLYESSQETFYQETVTHLQIWEKALTIYLDRGRVGSRPGSSDGNPIQDTGLHVYYHYAALMLNRYVRHQPMTASQVARNCKKAYSHARKILELMQKISNHELKDIVEPKAATSSPITGHAILMAIDVLTAAGTMSSVLDSESREAGNHQTITSLLFGGIEALERHSEHWQSAKHLVDRTGTRVGTIISASRSGASSRKVAYCVRDPLNKSFDKEEDIVYGLPRLEYLHALGSTHVKRESEIYEVGRTPSPRTSNLTENRG